MNTLNIKENFPMRNFISFRTGGNARFFAEISDEKELIFAKKFAQDKNIPLFLLGNGTNILIADSGYNGFIIRLGKSFSYTTTKQENENLFLKTGAASLLGSVARKAADAGFGSIHMLSGIPGTIGGAVYMNAGAYNQEIADATEYVKILNENGEIQILEKKDCDFSYRSSLFQKTKDIILEASLKLKQGNRDELEKEIADAMKRRRESQPLDKPNAGSCFKRLDGYFPGKLIEEASLKGFQIGDAQVSEKHANFIVNLKNAKATDIAKVFKHVENVVFEKFGIQMKREVIFLGDFEGIL